MWLSHRGGKCRGGKEADGPYPDSEMSILVAPERDCRSSRGYCVPRSYAPLHVSLKYPPCEWFSWRKCARCPFSGPAAPFQSFRGRWPSEAGSPQYSRDSPFFCNEKIKVSIPLWMKCEQLRELRSHLFRPIPEQNLNIPPDRHEVPALQFKPCLVFLLQNTIIWHHNQIWIIIFSFPFFNKQKLTPSERRGRTLHEPRNSSVFPSPWHWRSQTDTLNSLSDLDTSLK